MAYCNLWNETKWKIYDLRDGNMLMICKIEITNYRISFRKLHISFMAVLKLKSRDIEEMISRSFAFVVDLKKFYSWKNLVLHVVRASFPFLTRDHELRTCERASYRYDVGNSTRSLARLVDSCKLFFDFRLLSECDSFWQAINKRNGDLCC